MTVPSMSEFLPLLPEIFLLSMACVILIVDLFLTEESRAISYVLALLTLLVTAILSYQSIPMQKEVVLAGTFINDAMASILKIFVYLSTIFVFIYSRDYLIQRGLYKGEFFVLVLSAVLGMMVMISAGSMLTLYLGLELLSLALYALVAMQRDSGVATEAAIKYFVLGAMASGLLLYGMSMIYGATGSLTLSEIMAYITANPEKDLVLLLGLVFIIVGLGFKLGAVPFHMWVPDVYHGAPTAMTLFIGTAPKLAGFAMVMRLLVEGLGGLHYYWQDLLIVLAVMSLLVGNVVAIAQTNMKRMLAYSTIAHMGFVFLGIIAGTDQGYAAAMFYAIVYTIMGLAAFGMILLLSRKGFEADNIEDFRGLNDRSPWFALMMLIVMFSMAGVPPALGFYAKLAVLEAVVDAQLTWLAVTAVVFSIIGVFYYLRIVKVMYFDKAEDNSPIEAAFDLRAALSANSVLILLLGIFPGALLAMCVSSIG